MQPNVIVRDKEARPARTDRDRPMKHVVRFRRLPRNVYGDTGYETRCGTYRVHRASRDLWYIDDKAGTLAETRSLSEARWWITKRTEPVPHRREDAGCESCPASCGICDENGHCLTYCYG